MAFDQDNFSPVGAVSKGNAPAIYSYTTTETLAQVKASGYFDNGSTANTGMRNVLKANDIIMLITETGGTPSMDIIKIDAVTAGVITSSTADINDA